MHSHSIRFSHAGLTKGAKFYRFGAGGRDDRDEDRDEPETGLSPGHDLAYEVELWDQGKGKVERVLAITANGSIGYAAYFEATKEHPDRYVTLRHKNRIMARWNPPLH